MARQKGERTALHEQEEFMERMRAFDRKMVEENRKQRNKQNEIKWRDDMIDSLAAENNGFKAQLAAKDAELNSSAERIAELEAQLQKKDEAVDEAVELIE